MAVLPESAAKEVLPSKTQDIKDSGHQSHLKLTLQVQQDANMHITICLFFFAGARWPRHVQSAEAARLTRQSQF